MVTWTVSILSCEPNTVNEPLVSIKLTDGAMGTHSNYRYNGKYLRSTILSELDHLIGEAEQFIVLVNTHNRFYVTTMYCQ